MSTALTVLAVAVAVLLAAAVMAVKIVKQYEQGVLFRLGKVHGTRQPGPRVIVPFVDVLHRAMTHRFAPALRGPSSPPQTGLSPRTRPGHFRARPDRAS